MEPEEVRQNAVGPISCCRLLNRHFSVLEITSLPVLIGLTWQ